MKKILSFAILSGFLCLATAATTINPTNRFAWGENTGWWDCRGDSTNGAVIGEYVCFGYIYAANVGWINLGGGAPTNGIQYQNIAANDFGVNHDGLGNLRGLAWCGNIGWVNFETLGAPRFDLKTGKLSGYIYSANCGWVSLSNAFAFVQTDSIVPGLDTNGDNLPDAWERMHFGNLSVNPNADPDGDGTSNLQEYEAGTDPNDADDVFRITFFDYEKLLAESNVELTWNSKLTRCYVVQSTPEIGTVPWIDSVLGLITPDGSSTTRNISGSIVPKEFYRIKAVKPLTP